ncbi:ABC transporter [Synergistes jonesii]|uniref:ABC transporter n=1 Tax=Synergistes jonesii TaxID=2754 RepID=A0A073ISI2_9BACT|nr:ABC transporter [Synergistes jonesii]OFB63279.1 ABC transporter [Synergistes jonesii]OFB64886.1 ABC transporter [Synergistes jonesii]OFB66286.1 ABC transporter [Synergistes jonesii]OFB69053.1 ABC transporter [Synergistes jonesii]
MDLIAEMLSYKFLVRAATVGLMVSLCAALLGVSLVLKRYSMIGDGLSHVGFGALAAAVATGASPLGLSIPVVIVAAVLLMRLTDGSGIKGDAAIGLISTSSLAAGVTAISLSSGINTDVCNYMFGSILAMSKGDVRLSVATSAAVLLLFLLCYNRIFAVTFDENFARATGVNAGRYNMVIAALTGVTIAVGMRLMGALLISGLIIFPAVTSMRLFKSFRGVVLSSAAVSLSSYLAGLVLSYAAGLPAGASIVLVNLVFFLAFAAAGRIR